MSFLVGFLVGVCVALVAVACVYYRLIAREEEEDSLPAVRLQKDETFREFAEPWEDDAGMGEGG